MEISHDSSEPRLLSSPFLTLLAKFGLPPVLVCFSAGGLIGALLYEEAGAIHLLAAVTGLPVAAWASVFMLRLKTVWIAGDDLHIKAWFSSRTIPIEAIVSVGQVPCGSVYLASLRFRPQGQEHRERIWFIPIPVFAEYPNGIHPYVAELLTLAGQERPERGFGLLRYEYTPSALGIALWCVLALGAVVSLFSLHFSAYFSGPLEAACFNAALPLAGILAFTGVYAWKGARWVRTPILPVLGGILAAAFFFSWGIVQDTRNRLLMECDGVVVEKYISDNHQRRRVVVKGAQEVVLENLSDDFWNRVKVGDRVRKSKRNPFVLVNGESVTMLNEREYKRAKGRFLPRSAYESWGEAGASEGER